LAKQGHYKEAIDAYSEALKRDPANADAAANRKAVEDWLKQQKNQSKQDQNKQDKNQQDKKQQQKQNPSSSKQQDSGDGKGEPKPGQQGQDGKSGTPPKSDEKPSTDPGKPSDKQGQNAQPDAQMPPSPDAAKPDQSKQDQSGKNQSGKGAAAQNQAGAPPQPLTPQQQAEQKASTDKAQQALQKQMDQALAGDPKNQQDKSPPTHQLGAMSKDDPDSKLPADLRQAIQRVPDDPGALLRRKFQLEYEQRHGGVPNEDDQP
jgi:Ca-activated chloride channel family protein